MKEIKKVLVVDWLDKYAGSERVISSFTKIFDFEKCFTLVNVMSKKDLEKTFSNKKIEVQQTPLVLAKHKFRFLFFLFHRAVRSFKLDDDVKLIISSSHSVSKGIVKNKNQLHISYFQARNQKYLWDTKLYFGGFSYFINFLIKYLRRIDIKLAQNPDYIIPNSNFLKNWIKKKYNRDSYVIYPPVDISQFSLQMDKQNFYVSVGRLEKYKRFDILVKAFNKTDKNLIIIGDGSEMKKLKKLANSNITFLGYQNSNFVREQVEKAKAFIHVGVEDFGIAPVEAQSCGTPVIGYKKGGLMETVIEGKTGLFFEKQNPDSIIEAIHNFNKISFDYKAIRQNALRFSSDRFEKEFRNFVENKIKEFYN